MYLKTENCCLKTCVEICVGEKVCENTCSDNNWFKEKLWT